MKAVRADPKRRVVIPGARPGDIFDVQRQGEERFVLVRLHRSPEAPRMNREACLDAMSRSPLNPTLRLRDAGLRASSRVRLDPGKIRVKPNQRHVSPISIGIRSRRLSR